jgi:hypothetical protein
MDELKLLSWTLGKHPIGEDIMPVGWLHFRTNQKLKFEKYNLIL